MFTESMVFAIARSLERLLADAMFGVSLILGWNLFRVGVLKDQTAELSGKGWKVRLQRVGPGVFFALFGAVGLVVALQKPLQETITHTDKGNGPGQENQNSDTHAYNYTESVNSGLPEYVTALTTVEYLGIRDDGTHSAEKDALLKAKPILEKHREALLRNLYPKYDWYLNVKKGGPIQLNRLSPEERKNYDEMEEIVNRTLIASDPR
jgi:hypothetical protein